MQIQQHLAEAEQARAVLNSLRTDVDEATYHHAESRWLSARDAVIADVQSATGVDFNRLQDALA